LKGKHIDAEKGVVSLEACVLVPFFIFLMLFLYGIIIMFMGQQMMSHSLIQSAESLSLDPYSTERLSLDVIDNAGDLFQSLYANLFTSGDNNFSSTDKWYSGGSAGMEDTIKDRFIGFLTGGDDTKAESLLNQVGVKGGIEAIDFSGCTVEGNVLTLTINYKQDFIFNFQGLASFDRSMSVKVNMWGLN